MHIAILSDQETYAGAAIATSRLAEGLHQAGHRVTRLVAFPDGQAHSWDLRRLSPPFPLVWQLRRWLFPHHELDWWSHHGFAWLMQNRLKHLLCDLRPDVINVHNLHGAFSLGWSLHLVQICAAYAPLVWTLHDMWSFTGRCAYSYDCRKFLTGCDATCPTPLEYPALAPQRIARAWQQRRYILAEHPTMVAVTPSRWLAQEAKTGLWASQRVEVIPNSLPLKVYRPVERAMARKALGLEPQGPVLLVAATDFTERRKGGAILIKALSHISRRPFTLVTLGDGKINLESAGIYWHPLGYVKDEQTKVLAYNAADLFVHPAPVDNLPNVVMEAIACGTPVVGLPIGGVPDMIRPGQTGWLADGISPEELARSIDTALNDLQQGLDLRQSCRMVAEADYSADIQAQRYLALFQSLQIKQPIEHG